MRVETIFPFSMIDDNREPTQFAKAIIDFYYERLSNISVCLI